MSALVVLSFVWFIINVLHTDQPPDAVPLMTYQQAEARYLAVRRYMQEHHLEHWTDPGGISWEWERGGTLKPISGEGKP